MPYGVKNWRVTILLAAVALSGCGGSTTQSSTTPSAVALTEAQIEQTVQARLNATATSLAQQLPTPTIVPTAAATATPEPTVKPTIAATATTAPTEAPTSAPTTAVAETASAAATTPPADGPTSAPVASGEGRVVVVGGTGSISTLSGGKWQVADLSGVKARVDDCYLSGGEVVFDDQGQPWALCNRGTITSSDGTAWGEPERGSAGENLQFVINLFRDQQKHLYVAHGGEVIKYADGKAETIGRPADFNKQTLPVLVSAAFLPDGKSYFTDTDNTLYLYDGSSWQSLGTVEKFSDNESGSDVSLYTTSKGELLGSRYTNLFKFDGSKFVPFIPAAEFGKFYKQDYLVTSISAVAETSDGRLWIGTRDYGLYVWDGSKLDLIDRSKGLPSNIITSIAVDANNKLWVGTGAGLAVGDGQKWELALPSTSDIAEAFITAVDVLGAPTLPAAAKEPKTATVTGRVSQGGKTVANTDIEISSVGGRSAVRGETPCSDQFFTQRGKTDDKGNYTFENVPLGTYTFCYLNPEDQRWAFFPTLYVPVLTAGEDIVQDLNTK